MCRKLPNREVSPLCNPPDLEHPPLLKTTSTYGADLIDVMGSDLTVVNAARVSFDKESTWAKCIDSCDDICSQPCAPGELRDNDKRLISYLAKHQHWTPFAHPQLSFRVSAPIFVARQLQKHQVGLAWNEVSRRYVDSEPRLYLPDTWRRKADNVKQGSSDEVVHLDCNSEAFWPLELYDHCAATYQSLLNQGVCAEQARMVLPQSMMTEWVWTGSLAAFARVVNQRLDPHAQRECRPVALDIAKALQEHFPVSWEALRKPNEPV